MFQQADILHRGYGAGWLYIVKSLPNSSAAMACAAAVAQFHRCLPLNAKEVRGQNPAGAVPTQAVLR
jgi:hypothetical protein